jgi:hypothetical protein
MVALLFSNGAVAAPFVSEAGGFSIDLPDGWQPLPKEQVDAMASSGVYLMAVNPEAVQQGKNFSIVGNKMPVPAEAGTVEKISAEQAEMMKSFPGLKGEVKSEIKSIAGRNWSRLAYAAETNGVTMAVVQYATIIDGTGYNFMFMTDDLAPYEASFDKAMDSFKLK